MHVIFPCSLHEAVQNLTPVTLAQINSVSDTLMLIHGVGLNDPPKHGKLGAYGGISFGEYQPWDCDHHSLLLKLCETLD